MLLAHELVYRAFLLWFIKMPTLKKKALSLYLRNGCIKQFVFTLYKDRELRDHGMPPRQQARAGLGLVGQAGYNWQDEKVSELKVVFGAERVRVKPTGKNNRPEPSDLEAELPELSPYQFVVEARFKPDTDVFKKAIGIDTLYDLHGDPLAVSEAFPDLIQVLPPMTQRECWEREEEERGPGAMALEVLPNGDTRPLAEDDTRLRLRVIDIKLASDPGAHYFAEVAYYSMALAAWFVEKGHHGNFVVVAAPAVWPGSYEASTLMKLREVCRKEGREPSSQELALALEEDLEIAPLDVFAPRLRQFFRDELPKALLTPWQDLPWHVFNACAGCEFLGYPWPDREGNPTNDPRHCWPTAEKEGHLSRVAGLTRGGASLLRPTAPDVAALAALEPGHQAFDTSSMLRAKRSVYPNRAEALRREVTGVIPDSGGDALMPQWPDLHVYVFIDYDLSSAITAAFSLRAFWREPLPYGSPLRGTEKKRRWSNHETSTEPGFQEVFLVDRRDLEREREEFLKFLRSLKSILDAVREADDNDVEAGRRTDDPDKPEKAKRSSYQIYLWDEAQRKHLTRLIGRHLVAVLEDQSLRSLAWLFPPPELLAHADEASYNSPFTLVSHVIQNTVAVPVPHHYTLLSVVQSYLPSGVVPPNVHPLYRDPLSDLIPGERLHEMWNHRGDWLKTANTVRETTQKKLSALAYVLGQLEKDLKPLLNRLAAPPVARAPKRLTGVPARSELWHEYTRLNQALQELDAFTVRAMPAHEREARFKSAHLLERLEGAAKLEALDKLSTTTQRPPETPDDLVVYTLSPTSSEFNVRPPALNYVLSPRDQPAFLNQPAFPLIKDHDIRVSANLKGSVAEVGLTKVSIEAIDRINHLIALRPDGRTYRVADLENAGVIDFRCDIILDPVSTDFLSKKVRLTLQGIGRPAAAKDDKIAARALGTVVDPALEPTAESPASEFLWQAAALASTRRTVDLSAARRALEAVGVDLNASQWEAWEAALTRRLALVWGPPGTGKSQTLRAVVAGAVWLADQAGTPLRLLIASGTYNAVDNVLLEADGLLADLLPHKPYKLVRIQSSYQASEEISARHPDVELLTVKTIQAPEAVQELQRLLEQPSATVVVAGTSQQLHNLAIATRNKSAPLLNKQASMTQRRWFDLVLIDEASQLDVAESTLVVSKAAEGATFVLAGDDKQLPPIHQATPPEDLEHVVGSVYSYVRSHHGVEPHSLRVNYRSNQTIVDFTKKAGYDPRLSAHHEKLQLALLDSFPDGRPTDWPTSLFWTPNWGALLDPAEAATCFVYEDEVASQANDFEADAVAALLWLLYGRVDRQLAGERGRAGDLQPLTGEPHHAREFWEHAVGVVTPHRAQMGKIVSRLQHVFPGHDPAALRGAVDTVERFQGQQRDVMIASFGIGDPDLIRAEDEFLYSLNRFNVMASRARAKLIVLVTRSLVDHLADDAEVLEESRLLKHFVEAFCSEARPSSLGYRVNGVDVQRNGVLRTRCSAGP